MNTIWRIEIDGVELFGVEKKNYKDDRQSSKTELYIFFVMYHKGDLVHTETIYFVFY